MPGLDKESIVFYCMVLFIFMLDALVNVKLTLLIAGLFLLYVMFLIWLAKKQENEDAE